ncbi:MAG: response regulator [Desulfobacteraceae bacterium]|nr:response regulator [Desulfobacteraceae bacterium]
MIKNIHIHRIFDNFTNIFNKLSLHYVLIIPFVLQIVVIVGMIGLLSFHSGKQAVNDLSAQLGSEIIDRVEERLQTYLAIPPIVNRVNMNTIKYSLLDLQDEKNVEKYLFRQLQIFPLITFNLWGEESKRYFCAIRQKDGTSQMLRMKESTGENLNFYATDRLGNCTTLLKSVHIGDPRNRPWYQTAKEAGKPTWTKIYPSNASQELSITAVSPFYDTYGNLQGVLGTAFQFFHVNKFLRSLQISPNGLIALMEDSGELITTSTDEIGFTVRDGKVIRIKAIESKNNIIRLTGKYIEEHINNLRQIHGMQQLHFDIDGEHYILQVSYMKFHENVNFLIVVIIPEADFMTQINKNTRMTILLCLLALATSIFIGVLTAQWVIRPIVNLSTSAKQIAKGRWNKTIHFKRSDELGELATSFSSMANQLKLSFERLEERVEERTVELTEANTQLKISKEKAEVANLAKSTFLANMSHELRTPLNGILGYAQILQRDSSVTEQQRHGLNVIKQSGDHLLALINDVLDLAKVESDKTELYETDFNVPLLLSSISEIIKIRVRHKGIDFYSELADDLPVCVHGDEKRLRQILLNLLGNAVKFTEKGSVTLRVRSHCFGDVGRNDKSHTANIRFEVQDSGIGISPEDLKSIFNPFQQAGDQSYHAKGTGLGLSISHNLVELMGGTLHVESQVGSESTFWFDIVLPFVQDGTDSKTISKRQIIGIQGEAPTVLVVDDNRENRAVLVDMLRPLGFHVLEAVDGRDGLDKAIDSKPDVTITDLRMPEMDGFELIRHIRESPELQKTMIITASASVFEEDQKRSVTMGSDAFLPKPVEADNLFDLLERHLNLTWVEQETIKEPDLSDKPIVFPSPETIAELYELALIGDINELTEYVSKLAQSDSRLQPFTNRIQHFLESYQMEEISNWLAPRFNEKES